MFLICCYGPSAFGLAQEVDLVVPAAGENPVTPEVRDAQVIRESSVERMLTITFDQRQTAPKELTELFATGGIVRRAVRRVWPDKQIQYTSVDHFKANRSTDPKRLTIATHFKSNLQTGGGGNAGVMTGTLTVMTSPPADEGKTDQFVSAINDQVLALLKSRANALHEQAAQERNEIEKQLAMLNDELSRRRERKQHLVKSLVGDLQPREVLLDSIQQLQRERQSLELEIVSMNVRIQGLEKQIAVNREKAQNDTDKNEAIENLEQVVKEREKQLQLIDEANRQVRSATRMEQSQARQELLMAKVQLAQAQSEQRKMGEMRIDHLVGQLAQNSIDLSVAEARLKHAKQQLEENLERLRMQEGVTLQAQQLDGEIDRLVRAQQQVALPMPIQTRLVEASIKIEDIDLEPKAASDKQTASERKAE
jgi:chromosome segregation ATPase